MFLIAKDWRRGGGLTTPFGLAKVLRKPASVIPTSAPYRGTDILGRLLGNRSLTLFKRETGEEPGATVTALSGRGCFLLKSVPKAFRSSFQPVLPISYRGPCSVWS